jgi:hypothetical protein
MFQHLAFRFCSLRLCEGKPYRRDGLARDGEGDWRLFNGGVGDMGNMKRTRLSLEIYVRTVHMAYSAVKHTKLNSLNTPNIPKNQQKDVSPATPLPHQVSFMRFMHIALPAKPEISPAPYDAVYINSLAAQINCTGHRLR